jgi:hypothetical protein
VGSDSGEESKDELVNRMAIALKCPSCGANSFEWCMTATGKSASSLHAPRKRMVLDVWDHGFAEGLSSGMK